MVCPYEASRSRPLAQRRRAVSLAGLFVIVVVALLWAKWLPYGSKIDGLAQTGLWKGGSGLLPATGLVAPPSFLGAWKFLGTYFGSVWKALVAALLIAAALDTLMPRTRFLRFVNRPSRRGQALVGGLASLPSMMCTCCTAPVTVGLKRSGAPRTASLAYWVGNPLLNPAVLVFLLLVLPWQFALVRVMAGAVVVFGASPLIVRWCSGGDAVVPDVPVADGAEAAPARVIDLAGSYLRSLARFAVIMVPEYVLVVLLVGWLSTGLGSFETFDARLGVLAVAAAAVAGTLLVIPTGAEIPVILGLLSAGASAGMAGTLLITLPALSLPSMIMVGRVLSWRVTLAMAAAVAVAGVAAGIALSVLL